MNRCTKVQHDVYFVWQDVEKHPAATETLGYEAWRKTKAALSNFKYRVLTWEGCREVSTNRQEGFDE